MMLGEVEREYSPWCCDTAARRYRAQLSRKTACFLFLSPSRRVIMLLSWLLMWAGSAVIAKGAGLQWQRAWEAFDSGHFAAMVSICAIGACLQAESFFRSSIKLSYEVWKTYAKQLLPWHFLPPWFVTSFILFTILVFALVGNLVGNDDKRAGYQVMLVVKIFFDTCITCGLLVGGAVFLYILMNEKRDSDPFLVGSTF